MTTFNNRFFIIVIFLCSFVVIKNDIFARNPKVGMLDVIIKDKDYLSKKMSEFIKDELKTKNRIDFVGLDINNETFKSIVFKKDPNKIENDELLSKINKLIEEKEYEMAIQLLDEVIKNYEKNFEHINDFYLFYKAYLDRAFLKNIENIDKDGKYDLRQAISMGRNYDFDAKNYSPRFLVKYKRERKRMKKKNASLTINNGKGLVYLDGMFMGTLPIKIQNISYGKHYLIIEDAGMILKKQIITFGKKKKNVKINIDNKKFLIDSDELAINIIRNNLLKNKITPILKLALKYISSKNSLDYLLFGYSNKKSVNYETELFLYSPFKNKIIKSLNAKFDEDLLSADVEALRVAKIIVKNVDNFDTIKALEPKGTLMKIGYAPYKKLKYNGIEKKKINVVPSIKEDKKNINVKREEKTTKEDLEDLDIAPDKNIKLDDADYSILKEKNKEKFKEKDSSSVFTSWWFWTSVAVVTIAGAGVGTYFILENRTNAVTPQISW